MLIITLCAVLLIIQFVCVSQLGQRKRAVDDVLEYLKPSELQQQLMRLNEEYIGLPEQKKMIIDIQKRLGYHINKKAKQW